MPAVNVEGLDKPVNFPDSMSHDEIVKAIETEILPRISKTGYFKTGLNALAKGAAGFGDMFANLPYNLINLSKMAAGSTATALGMPEFAPDVSVPPSPFSNLGSSIGVIRPGSEPINTQGRVLDFTGQLVGSGGRNPLAFTKVNPALLKTLAVDTGIGVSGGVGQELGQRALGDKGGVVGGILGAGLPAAASTMRGTNAANLNKVLSGLTQEQLNAAEALQRRSVAMGSPTTGAEAINQTVGSIPALQTMQRVAEQSTKGSPILSQFMNARPAGNVSAFDQALAPMGGIVDPRMVAANAQTAAESAITKQRQAGNAQAKPFYDASVNSEARVPADVFDTLRSNPIVQSALESVRKDPLSGLSSVLEPPGSMRWLDAARKQLSDTAQAAKIAGRNYESMNASKAADQINQALNQASPQYAVGQYITGGNMRFNVAPMEAGPVGKIASTSGEAKNAATTQFNALVNSDNATPEVIRKAVGQLNMNNPSAARELAIMGLQNEFDSATARLVSGPAQGGGAKFAKEVDTPKVQAYLESLPNGKQVYLGFRNMLDVFEAQGTRSPAGSLTATNLQSQKELTGFGVGVAADPAKWLPAMRDFYDNFRFGKNTEEMARILVDPNSVAKMRKLAMLNPSSPSARYLVSQIVNREATQ